MLFQITIFRTHRWSRWLNYFWGISYKIFSYFVHISPFHVCGEETNRSIHKGVYVSSKKNVLRDFLGGPVVKTLPSNSGGVGSIPGQGTKIPQASWPKNQNTKQKQYCNKFNKDLKKNGPHQKRFFFLMFQISLNTNFLTSRHTFAKSQLFSQMLKTSRGGPTGWSSGTGVISTVLEIRKTVVWGSGGDFLGCRNVLGLDGVWVTWVPTLA